VNEILAVFERRSATALFVTELAHALPAPERASLDAQLERLSGAGALIVTEHDAPDPHLAGADLRVVAPLAPDGPRVEAEAAAAKAAESFWNKWLAGFLSSHRCQ
jgi:hypothetical protein